MIDCRRIPLNGAGALEQPTELDRKIRLMPDLPGVYLMKDAKARIHYVGKAKSLKARTRSYIHASADHSIKVRRMMEKTVDVDFIATDTEKEALLLEASLIKRHRPRYNVVFRDDKSYVHLLLDRNHPFPKISIVRRPPKGKKGLYTFGPYFSKQAVTETLRFISEIFPLRTCRDAMFRNRSRPCLNHQIGKCLGPCCGLVDEGRYAELVDGAVLVLRGRKGDLLKVLRQEMHREAEALHFELAARLRDRIQAIEKTVEKQKVSGSTVTARDVLAYAWEGKTAMILILSEREGELADRKTFPVEVGDEPVVDEVMGSFVKQHYTGTVAIPEEILLPVEVEDRGLVAELLTEKKGRKVKIAVPKRGRKVELVRLAEKNASLALRERIESLQSEERTLARLRSRLHLGREPRRIECFDISTLGGEHSVGSMVVFEGTEPRGDLYRRYRVKGVEGVDDFAMMGEVLMRRFKKGIETGALPDLAIVDGGKGQLNVAAAVFAELGVTAVDLVALAKKRRVTPGEPDGAKKGKERVYLPGRKNPILLDPGSRVTKLLARVRDESHRFAIDYNRRLRRKALIASVLDEIDGVGPGWRQKLLTHFGDLQRIAAASLQEIEGVPGLPTSLAGVIHGKLSALEGNVEQDTLRKVGS